MQYIWIHFLKTKIYYLKVSASRWKNEDVVSIHKLWKDADGILETALLTNILRGQIVPTSIFIPIANSTKTCELPSDDFSRISGSYSHAEISQPCFFEARHNGLQRRERMHGLFSAFHFCLCQIFHINAAVPENRKKD